MRDLFSELYGQRAYRRDRNEELMSNEDYYAREDRIAKRERKMAQKYGDYSPLSPSQLRDAERLTIRSQPVR